MNRFKMTGHIYKLAAAVVATTLIAAHSSAQDVPAAQDTAPRLTVEVASPDPQVSQQIRNTLARALTRYAASCARTSKAHQAVFTRHASIELATPRAGEFRHLSAARTTQCWSVVGTLQPVTIYATSTPDSVFISYFLPGSTGPVPMGLALIDMRGSRIARIRDFSTQTIPVVTAATIQGR